MKALKIRPGALKTSIIWMSLWFAVLLFFEILLHSVVFGKFSVQFLYSVGFTVAFAAALAFIHSLIPQKYAYWCCLTVTVLLIVFYGSEVIYYYVFGGLYSAAQAKLGGGAITSFWRELVITVRDHRNRKTQERKRKHRRICSCPFTWILKNDTFFLNGVWR